MKQNFNNLSENEKMFLKCILDKGNMTDTEISKTTQMSKATISRVRKKLENNLISEYLPVIKLDKVGIEIFSVLTFQWNAFNNKQLTEQTFEEFEKNPNIIFLANGNGSQASTVIFIAFKNLDEYHNYLKDFKQKYSGYVLNLNTLLLPSHEIIKNDFTEIIKKTLEVN